MKTKSILKQTVNCPLIPPDPGASPTARRLYCAFHKHANSKVQKPPSQLCLSLPSIIITITSNEPWNTETHKTDRNPPITNHKPWPFENFCFLRGPLRWLTAAKNAIVGLLLNFRICMFEKRAILICGPQSTRKRTIFSNRRKIFSFKIFLMVFFSNLKE